MLADLIYSLEANKSVAPKSHATFAKLSNV